MIYQDLNSIYNRISQVKEYKVQTFVIVFGTFISLLYEALFENHFGLIIESIAFTLLGISVIKDKKSIINLTDNGPMKDVYGAEAIKWGIYYILFGLLLLGIYLFF